MLWPGPWSIVVALAGALCYGEKDAGEVAAVYGFNGRINRVKWMQQALSPMPLDT